MTSTPLVQPRPQPSTSNSYSPIRQRSFASLPTSNAPDPGWHSKENVLMVSGVQERPTKRRKIDSYGSSPVSETGVEPTEERSGEEKEKQKPIPRYVAPNWDTAVFARSVRGASTDTPSEAAPPLPPQHRNSIQVAERGRGRIRTSCRYRADVVVPSTPDGLHCPVNAPVLETKKAADYYPWAGKHAEDVINETNVKQGYCDRAPHPAERELNTARAPLHNAFKHRSGLESLSAVFSLVLDQKNKHGTLSSTSTFRPPPRVTLTEAKRRSWIADLADGDVPLRRLSRTIPQGVRGLSLLDQCLVNSVPVNRAVWFIKCVGANEIRTLKRKGITPGVAMGTENKWLRDWTINIEHFLDAAIGQCGSEKWSENIRYCLQLCTRLYQENLLDRDHFLDWIVKNTAGCSLELLAVWLPMIQLFRLDLLRFRKRARQLGEAVVVRFEELSVMGSAGSVLETKLRSIIRGLATFRPACFLMPERWQQYRQALRSCLNLQNDNERRILEHLERRNQRQQGTDSTKGNSTNFEKDIYETLDNSSIPFNIGRLSDQLVLLASSDHTKLTKTCLKWATSRFRGGTFRVYLVARMVRRWQRAGHKVDVVLLDFFSSEHNTLHLDLKSYRHLFAELSRSQSFSKSRFMQSLSIRGQVREDADASLRNCSFLLRDMCLVDTENHMINLRHHLLKSQNPQATEEESQTKSFKASIDELITEVNSTCGTGTRERVSPESLQHLNWSARFNISSWLRDEAVKLSQLAIYEVPDKPSLPGSHALTLRQVVIIRDVLQALDDIAVLADVLYVLSSTRQEEILATLVDTIHYNVVALSAIGALEPLQKRYGDAYIALRATRPSILLFAVSLLDLCQTSPCQTTPVRALQQDLVRGDRGRALAACSPFSDGIAESLQQAGATFNDDFEAILLGEPNMNEQTMTSLFSVLVGRIMKNESEVHGQSTFTLCQLLSRLRMFRVTQGNLLIKRWLTRMFTAAWSASHHAIIMELLHTRCVTLETLIELSCQAPPVSKSIEHVAELATAGVLAQPTTTTRPQHAYVVRIAVQRLIASSPLRALEIFLPKAGAEPSLLDHYAPVLLRVLKDNKDLSTLNPLTSRMLAVTLGKVLGAFGEKQASLSQLISHTNWLSLPYCSFLLLTLYTDESKPMNEEEAETKAMEVFRGLRLQEGDSGLEADLTRALLDAMPSVVQERVRITTEQQFFRTLPKFFQAKTIAQPIQYTAEEKSRSLEAVGKLISLGPVRRSRWNADSNGILVEKLTIIHKVLGSRIDTPSVNSINSPITSSPGPSTLQSLQNALPAHHWDARHRDNIMGTMDYLDMLLKVTSTKVALFASQSGPNGSTMSKAMQNEQIKLIALLASIATQPSLAQLLQSNVEDGSKSKIRDCVSFALDVAARLADDLSDEARMHCTRIMKDRLRDQRVMWLVGSMNLCASVNNTGEYGLVLVHETRGHIGDFRPKQWEMLESGGGKDSDTCLGLGLFGAKRV